MARRKIIKIDESLCDGCGSCVLACPENAIEIIDGKARVVRESLCDGLGACIGNCPQGALSIEEREAEKFDELAANAAIESTRESPLVGGRTEHKPHEEPGKGCPGALRGTGMGRLGSSKLAEKGRRPPAELSVSSVGIQAGTRSGKTETELPPGADRLEIFDRTELSNWPIQMRLAHVDAPYFDGARLLIAADCTAFASPAVHPEFIRGRVTLIGCPKLDERASFVERLAAILAAHEVEDVIVLEMEVPCCSNLEALVRQALKIARKDVPVKSFILGIDGSLQS